MVFKSSNAMAGQSFSFGILATAKCGCTMSNPDCGKNTLSSTGTQTTSQCGANVISKDNPTYASNK